jgi:D-alanyl-D-alanine dipeptidase
MLVWRTATARETTVGAGIVRRTACKAASSQRITALSVDTRSIEHGLSARPTEEKPPAASCARTGHIRYATADNIVHRPVYRQARAFLQRPAAEALVRARRELASKGYGLLVFDGYRPWSVTKFFWDNVRPDQRAFVADPKKGSKHNRGCAVDLSLYDLAMGREVEMPSAYDETSERASPDYAGGTPEQRARRDLLRAAMEKEGFTVEENEWWHFNFRDWKDYPILDIPFEAIP